MPDHVPIPPPNLQGKVKPLGTDLTPAQKEIYETVLKHFDSEDYRLPGEAESDEEAGKLKEVEKFWLVCTVASSLMYSHANVGVNVTCSRTSACFGASCSSEDQLLPL